MKKTLIILLSLFCITFVYADRDHDDDHARKHGNMGSAEEMFKSMDRNQDGSITLSEFKEAFKKYENDHSYEGKEDHDDDHHGKSWKKRS